MSNFSTTRAYKLKLSESSQAKDENDSQNSWRRHVWNTHYIVNRGVWVWGDWLLTLRGGLPATLADEASDRCVILALSWLSVEAPCGLVPQEYRLTDDGAKTNEEKDAVVQRFKEILQQEGVDHIEEWIERCEPALRAKIRTDAVWVDRWACFQKLKQMYSDLSQEWATGTLFNLLGGETSYFQMPNTEEDVSSEPKDFSQKAGNWLSKHWGAGNKSDPEDIFDSLSRLTSINRNKLIGRTGKEAVVELLKQLSKEPDPTDLEHFKQLKNAIGWGTGRESAGALALKEMAAKATVNSESWQRVLDKFKVDQEKLQKKIDGPRRLKSMPEIRIAIESQIGLPYRIEKDFTWEFAVMLDHALRRLSVAHSWIKRAESERAKFANDAKRMDTVITPASEWLDNYCQSRALASGAVEPYIIRQRAIEGWPDILKAWRQKSCQTVEDRQEAVRIFQSETEKKFDAALLLALAEEDAEIVWRDNKQNYLSDYSAAQVALQNQTRFKVPAYRHPDPLRHPVWVDFGNSRWDIEYAVQAANQPAGETARKRNPQIVTKQQEAGDTLRKQLEKVEKVRQGLAQTKSEKQTQAKDQKLQEELCRLERYQEQEDWLKQTQGVELDLWTGEDVKAIRLHWSNKRLVNNLALNSPQPEGKELARADRLGRAVGGWPGDEAMVAAVFSDKQWPGRLQSDRRRFDRWADKLYGGKQQQPTAEIYDSAELKEPWDSPFWQHLPWYLSYSATLELHGPMFDPAFAQKLDAAGWAYKEIKGNMVLYHPTNKEEKRSGRTRLQLPLVDGLRVLSFDLGLRFAASCAVWQVLTEINLLQEIGEREITYGGHSPNDLFVHTSHTDPTTGKLRKTIYRRLSPTMWARLDRQFTIKLPGEDQQSRKSTPEEIAAAIAVLEPLGVYDEKTFEQESGRIDDLQAHLVQQLRRALRRHGDLARAANALQATSKPLAGGRTYQFLKPNADNETADQRREKYEKFLADGLVRWYRLIETDCASNDNLKDLFDEHFGSESFAPPEPDESPIQAKKREKKLAEQFLPVAQKLAGDRQLRETLAQKLTTVWKKNDSCWQGKGGYLRKLRRLIIPRLGKKPRGDSPEFPKWQEKWKAMQNVGGLSLQRISTIRGTYQLMRAYYTRPKPEDLNAGIRRIENDTENGFRFGKRILNAMEGMRTNRVKQLASRIIEAALGVGSEKRSVHFHGRKRPNRQIFKPCQIVVGEDLEHYRPDQKQLRSENRNVQQWCARNVRRFIIEGCQLYGLHFDEAPPQYTSLQDSRTGAPGLRCRDMTAQRFLEASWLQKRIVQLQKKQSEGDLLTPSQSWLIELQGLAVKCCELGRKNQILRFDARGADLFVSADGNSPAAMGLQADINAAANIGLRKLLHPDWPGSWTYLPVQRSSGSTDPKKLSGSPLLSEALVLLSNEEDRKNAPGDVLNAWSDPTSASLSQERSWLPRKKYQENVEQRVVNQLRKVVREQIENGNN